MLLICKDYEGEYNLKCESHINMYKILALFNLISIFHFCITYTSLFYINLDNTIYFILFSVCSKFLFN